MKIININELKIIQLDILEVLDKFCREHEIHYSLACGSMLGAVRHGGYIPWDDDIDIYIPRKDYEKLVASFPSELDSVSLMSLERDQRWYRSYAQAYNNRTVVLEEAYTPIEIGVYLDVYPIDNVPDSDEDWMKYNKKRRTQIRLYEMKYIKFSKNRSFVKNVILALNKFLLLPFSLRTIAKRISAFAQKHNNKGYKRSFECVQGMLQKRPFPSSLLEETIPFKFEDREFMVMKDYKTYLTNGYGDYMKLPPKEKQVSHHVFKAWWKD